MKKFVASVAVLSTAFVSTPSTAYADQWGCTIFLCFASPTNPMAIGDCAAAILKIRPWKKPSCSSVNVQYSEVRERYCPKGSYRFDGGFDLRKAQNVRATELEKLAIGDEEGFGFGDTCYDPETNRTFPARLRQTYEAAYYAGEEFFEIYHEIE